MNEPPPPDEDVTVTADPVEASDRLDADLLYRMLTGKRMLRIIAGSLIFDIVLSVLVLVGHFNTRDLVARLEDSDRRTQAVVAELEAVSNAGVVACLASNDSAAKQHLLWKGLLTLPKAKDAPPTDPKTVAAFNKLLNETFVQQDCGLK